jgi:hypothetical protein
MRSFAVSTVCAEKKSSIFARTQLVNIWISSSACFWLAHDDVLHEDVLSIQLYLKNEIFLYTNALIIWKSRFNFTWIIYIKQKQINWRICIAPTLPFRVADRQTSGNHNEHSRTATPRSQQLTNQNGKLFHCHRWDSSLRPLARKHTSLTTRPSPNPKQVSHQNFTAAIQEMNLLV